MATKAQLIREYLTKHSDVGPSALAKQMMADHKSLNVNPNEVSNIKSLMRKEQAGVLPSPAAPAPAKANGDTASKTHAQAASSNGRAAAVSRPASAGLADQVGKLKAVVAVIGKAEAKQIIDLL